MKLPKRIIVIILCVSLILGVIAITTGCEKEDDQVTVVMVESITSPQRTAVITSIIEKFEAENPNIHIELISPPLEGADQKIRQMLLNKNDIDILEVRDNTVKEFTNNDYLAPLDDYIDTWDSKDTLSSTTHQTATRIGGKYYLMPYGFYQKMIFYRIDWLEEAGIDVPTTWNELVEASIALTDPSIGRYGWTLRGISGGQGMVNSIATDKLGKDGIEIHDNLFTSDGKSIFGTPEAVEAFELLKKLYVEASPKDAISWGYPDQCQAFTSGVTAFLPQDPEVVAICAESMEDGTWGTMPMPIDDESGQAGINVGYAGWGVSAHSEVKDEAWKFISFLSNEENNTEFCLKYSVIPIHTTAGDKEDFFKSGGFAPYVYMNSNPDKYFLNNGSEKYAEGAEFGKMAEVDFQKVLQDEQGIEETLEKWAAYWNAVERQG